MPKEKPGQLYDRIREILESARTGVARTVNTTQVVANWLIGREIVEEEQRGKKRAGYGAQLLRQLSGRLRKEFGAGFSVDSLERFRGFFLQYPVLLKGEKSDALRRISSASISAAPRRISDGVQKLHAPHAKSGTAKSYALHDQSGSPSEKTGALQISEVEEIRTQRVRNRGSRARFIRICRGRTTARCCEWIAATLVHFTRSRRSGTIGQPESWSGKSTACFTSVWPRAAIRPG